MEHHLARDLLEGYVDNSLEVETRSQLESHLETCTECRAILEATETPIELSPVAGPRDEWDEKRMRKTVRRTLFRLVFDALSLWIIGAIILTLVSALAIQPVLINRGDRSRAAALATWDLAIMTTPGASIDSWQNDASLFGREISVDVGMYTGREYRPLGSYQTELGIWRFRNATGGGIGPFLGTESQTFQPDRLPEDTVATIALSWWDNPITMEQAAAIQPDFEDAWLLWVGFSVAPAFPPGTAQFPADPDYVLGFNPCGEPVFTDYEPGYFSSGSSGGGGNFSSCFFLDQATVEQSVTSLRRATANLAGHRFLVDALEDSSSQALRNIETVSAWLAANEPQVVTMVITGPSHSISDIVATSGAEGASLLDVDFWNWEG